MARPTIPTTGVSIDVAELSGLWWRTSRDARPAADGLAGVPKDAAQRRFSSGTVLRDATLWGCSALIVDHGALAVVHVAPTGAEVVLVVLSTGHAVCPRDLDTVVPGCVTMTLTEATCTFLSDRGGSPVASLERSRSEFHRAILDGLFFACMLSAKDRVWRALSFAQARASLRAKHAAPGDVPFQLACTHRQLASLVNVAPETLSRLLVTFQREGVIRRYGPWINVLQAAPGSRPAVDEEAASFAR